MLNILDLKKELKAKASPKKAKTLQRFFKTGPGEYGEHDVFLGVVVPDIRVIVKKYSNYTKEQKKTNEIIFRKF